MKKLVITLSVLFTFILPATLQAQEFGFGEDDFDLNDARDLYERLNNKQLLPNDLAILKSLQQWAVQDSLVFYKTFTDKNGKNNLEIKLINPCREPQNEAELNSEESWKYFRYDGWINYIFVSLSNKNYSDTLVYYHPGVGMTLMNPLESDIVIKSISNKDAIFLFFYYCGTQDPEEREITCIVMHDQKKYLFHITQSNGYIEKGGNYFPQFKVVDNLDEKLTYLSRKLRKEVIKHIKFRYETTLLEQK